MNILFSLWIIALGLFIFFARKCYRWDRHCGLTLLLGFMVAIPASLYLVSEMWLMAFS